MEMNAAIDRLKANIVASYNKNAFREEMKAEFAEKIHHTEGKKYIKIINGGGVWGFVVNTHDDKKFNYGDVLKAAGWSTPARNAARGSVFNDDYKPHWTGPDYLK